MSLALLNFLKRGQATVPIETSKAVENESKSSILAEKLNQIVEKLKKVSQEPAIKEFRADTELINGYSTKAQIRQFTLDIDEKPGLGGNRGSNLLGTPNSK